MLTVQRISGALRSGGFKAGKYMPTGIRGWTEPSPGFRTTKSWPEDGSITVSYIPTRFGADRDLQYIREQLQKMADFLRGQGYVVADVFEERSFKVRERT